MNNQDKNEFAGSTPAIWIDLKTIAEIKHVTPRALRMALSKDKYTFRQTKT